ncbi:hypothetical protein [Salibacterium aidingense]|uniref:hypothetical protein n=1 Tax=Salibacterium aidingense TaxID=384933 RepID=UPI00041DA44E|nr:hypothetical protein [Salibacterium aidingense]
MNNFRWNVPFFRMGRRRGFMGWNNRANNNWGRWSMFLTLLGAGAGAAWVGLTQGRMNNRQPVRERFSDIPARTETAFAEEFMPDESE